MVQVLDFEEVDRVFYYDETSPSCLRWKVAHLKKHIGDVVGYLNKDTWVVYYNKRNLFINKIIWVLNNKTSVATSKRLFYKDGNPLNTKISNLTDTKSLCFSSRDRLPCDKDFCVYSHKDSNGNLLYIGSGVTSRRPYDKTGRKKEHLAVFDTLSINIIKDGLTKRESLLLEKELISINKETLKFNKVLSSAVKELIFEDISKLLYYDESSPTCLRWKTNRYNTYGGIITKIGDVAGSQGSRGYIRVYANKTEYLAHRLVWCLCTKQNFVSDLVIDHIDRNRLNNRIDNLRLVTWSSNSFNKGLDKNNKSGVSGVFWCVSTSLWVVTNRHRCNSFNRTFNPKYLYPNLLPEEAKQKAFEDAVAYRNEFLEYVGVV